jgi:hypothetical protein
MFSYGGIRNQSDLGWSLLVSSGTVILYGCLEEVKGMNFSITPSQFPYYSLQFKIWLILVFTITNYLLVYHLWLADQAGIFWAYLNALLAIPGLYLYWYWGIIKLEPGADWHLHHWFIGGFCALFWRFDDEISRVAFSIYWGVFLSGAINGLDPIIYN